MKIIVFGLGYVGLTSAACALMSGHTVYGIDVSAPKVSALNQGKCPIYEPGLEQELAKGITSSKFFASTEIGSEIDDADLALVCVGTPSQSSGDHNMSYIAEVSRQISMALQVANRKTPLSVAYRSTMRPGSMSEIVSPIFQARLEEMSSEKVRLVYNPEFLRESTALKDYFSPPKIVVGTADGLADPALDELYKEIEAPRFYTKFPEAEITKFVDNSFHALKVTFANEVGRIAAKYGVSAKKMHEIFISDTKLNISPYYLRPGGAFGGSCLPKDVRALVHLSKSAGANTHLLDSLIPSNEDHKRFLYDSAVNGIPNKGRILLNGLAFKNESDDLRDSPLVDIASMVLDDGFELVIYDPYINVDGMHGANLGFGLSHLPALYKLIVGDLESLRDQSFDLIIDGRGNANKLPVKYQKIFDVNSLA